MSTVNRTVPGLRDAMFDVLEALRGGKISLQAARTQLETAKTICMTVACERTELQIIQHQIELESRMAQIEDQRKVIDYDG